MMKASGFTNLLNIKDIHRQVRGAGWRTAVPACGEHTNVARVGAEMSG